MNRFRDDLATAIWEARWLLYKYDVFWLTLGLCSGSL
jgi:hypothetical protein